MKIQFSLERKTFFGLLGGITILVLFLGSSRLLQAISNAAHDDRHFLDQAISIVQGNWLGKYDQYTLIKGSFYPIFLAFNYVLGLPLLISQQVIYCLSGLALIYALSYFCRHRIILLLIYSLYVFHPLPFIINRTVREGVYASLTTFVIAGVILITADLMGKVKNPKVAIYHACLFGLSLSGFWLTREEGIWIFPCIIWLVGLGLIGQYRQSRSLKILFRQSRTLILGLLITLTCVFGIAFTNYARYGVFLARSELVSTELKAAYGSLTRVKSEFWDSHIPVPRQARRQIYAKSEKFRSLKPYLEDPNTINGWSQVGGCPFYPSTCGDYAGGWFVWALRDAVAYAGYADTAPHALKFYRDLATEVNGLCDSKQLQCTPPRTGTMPPLRRATLQALPPAIGQGIKLSFGLSQLTILQDSQLSTKGAKGLKLFTEWTRTPTTPTQLSKAPPKHPTPNTLKLNVLNWLNVMVYQHLLFYVNFLALGVWCIRLLLSICRVLPWSILYVIATGILLAIMTRIVILAIVDVTSFPGIHFLYLMPGAVLVPIFTILVLADPALYRRKLKPKLDKQDLSFAVYTHQNDPQS